MPSYRKKTAFTIVDRNRGLIWEAGTRKPSPLLEYSKWGTGQTGDGAPGPSRRRTRRRGGEGGREEGGNRIEEICFCSTAPFRASMPHQVQRPSGQQIARLLALLPVVLPEKLEVARCSSTKIKTRGLPGALHQSIEYLLSQAHPGHPRTATNDHRSARQRKDEPLRKALNCLELFGNKTSIPKGIRGLLEC